MSHCPYEILMGIGRENWRSLRDFIFKSECFPKEFPRGHCQKYLTYPVYCLPSSWYAFPKSGFDFESDNLVVDSISKSAIWWDEFFSGIERIAAAAKGEQPTVPGPTTVTPTWGRDGRGRGRDYTPSEMEEKNWCECSREGNKTNTYKSRAGHK